MTPQHWSDRMCIQRRRGTGEKAKKTQPTKRVLTKHWSRQMIMRTASMFTTSAFSRMSNAVGYGSATCRPDSAMTLLPYTCVHGLCFSHKGGM